MAIIIEGANRCTICGDILDAAREYMGIPPLISNSKDRLFQFSDEGVHIACIRENSLSDLLFRHIDLYNRLLPLSEARCIVDGKRIERPEDVLVWGR